MNNLIETRLYGKHLVICFIGINHLTSQLCCDVGTISHFTDKTVMAHGGQVKELVISKANRHSVLL